MLSEQQLAQYFRMDCLPIKDWDGKPRYYSNLKKYDLSLTQKYGKSLIDYSMFKVPTGVGKYEPMRGHNGLDVGFVKGTPICAPCHLFITYIQTVDNDGYGLYVFGETESKHINGEYYKLELVFGHFESISVKSGRWLNKNDVIGGGDSTGFSTGNHLHFGVRPFWSKDGNTYQQMYPYNGYGGYIDPELFLPHIINDIDELLHPEKFKGQGIFKPKGYKKVLSDGGGYHWVAL